MKHLNLNFIIKYCYLVFSLYLLIAIYLIASIGWVPDSGFFAGFHNAIINKYGFTPPLSPHNAGYILGQMFIVNLFVALLYFSVRYSKKWPARVASYFMLLNSLARGGLIGVIIVLVIIYILHSRKTLWPHST